MVVPYYELVSDRRPSGQILVWARCYARLQAVDWDPAASGIFLHNIAKKKYEFEVDRISFV